MLPHKEEMVKTNIIPPEIMKEHIERLRSHTRKLETINEVSELIFQARYFDAGMRAKIVRYVRVVLGTRPWGPDTAAAEQEKRTA